MKPPSELLERLLAAHRYREAARTCRQLLAERVRLSLPQRAVPAHLRRASLPAASGGLRPRDAADGRSAGLLAARRRSTSVISRCRRSPSPRACRCCGRCCAAAASASTRRWTGADRVTVAVTLFALLELYKQGELTLDAGCSRSARSRVARAVHGPRWSGPRERGGARPARGSRRRRRSRARARGAAVPLDASRSAPTRSRPRPGAELHEVSDALERLREYYEFERRGLVLREAGRWLAARLAPGRGGGGAALFARPRTPPLTRAQAETLAIVAYLQPVSRPEIAQDPRRQRRVRGRHAARARADRGGRSLAVRRGPVPQHRSVPAAVRAATARGPPRRERVRPLARGRAGAAGAAASRGRRSRRCVSPVETRVTKPVA